MNYYTLRDAAAAIGVKVRTLREWLRYGKLNAKKFSGDKKWYVPQSEIDRLKRR